MLNILLPFINAFLPILRQRTATVRQFTMLNLLVVVAVGLSASPATAQQSVEPTAVEAKIEQLKQEVIALNRDLFILEEDLLFPASTQVAVYLAMDVGSYFQLDSIELRINDELATQHLYTQRQLDALKRGGVQRLYIGNIGSGTHQVTAYLRGIGPQKREYKRAASLTIDKSTDAIALEINILDVTGTEQPDFVIEEL